MSEPHQPVPQVEPGTVEPSQRASTEFLLHETEQGPTRVECRLVDDSLWLSQALTGEKSKVAKRTAKKEEGRDAS